MLTIMFKRLRKRVKLFYSLEQNDRLLTLLLKKRKNVEVFTLIIDGWVVL